MIDVADLLARARQHEHDPEAARALADLVEERLLRRRGGDRQADHRRRRDEAIRALARLTGNDRSVERQARDLAQRLARYRSQAFTLAEQLIRDATRAIIVEEADRAAVLDTLRARDRSAR
jgi:hypothetical protein